MAPKKVQIGDGIYLQLDDNGVITLTAEDANSVATIGVFPPAVLLEMQGAQSAGAQSRRMAAPGNYEVDTGRIPPKD
jgi:hypothetical protein